MWIWTDIIGFAALLSVLPENTSGASNFRDPNIGRNNLNPAPANKAQHPGNQAFYSAPTVFVVDPKHRLLNANPGPAKTGNENYRQTLNAKRSISNDNYGTNYLNAQPAYTGQQNFRASNDADEVSNGNSENSATIPVPANFPESRNPNFRTIEDRLRSPEFLKWRAARLLRDSQRPYNFANRSSRLRPVIPGPVQPNRANVQPNFVRNYPQKYEASQYTAALPLTQNPALGYTDDRYNEVQDPDNSRIEVPENTEISAENVEVPTEPELPEEVRTTMTPIATTLPDITRKVRQDDDDGFADDTGFIGIGTNWNQADMGELPGSPDEAETGELGESYVEWCEGNKRKRVKQSQCEEITFAAPFPSCYCIEGMASVRMDKTKNCDTTFHFAKAGCYDFESLGHGTRSIRLEQNFQPTDFVVAVEVINDMTSEWSIMSNDDLQDGTLIQIQRNVVILNGELFQSESGNYIQKLNCKVVRTYRNVYGTYQVRFERCPGFAISDSRLVSKRSLVNEETQLCTPTCKCIEKAKSAAENAANAENAAAGPRGQYSELELPSLEPFCKPIPPMLRSLHDDLNSRILRRSIDRAFEAQAELPDLKPHKSFHVLEKLAEITHKVCKNGGVSRRFLDTAVDLFKVAHEGRGFYFHEVLAPRDHKYIIKALEHCLDDVDPLEFYQTDCDGAITDVKNGTRREAIKLSSDHEYFDHHVVLDVSWNMVDLVNVVCVDAFKHSYRMYHEMEQGLEKLFTRELRSLWQYPDYPRNFYERLFGIFWENTARNLEMCVEGSYLATNKRMWRLNRPTWIEGRGAGTRGEKICKRRLTNEADKLLSTSYEIYCNSLECA